MTFRVLPIWEDFCLTLQERTADRAGQEGHRQGRELLTGVPCWGDLLSPGFSLDRREKAHWQLLVHIPPPGGCLPGDTPSPASPRTPKIQLSSGTRSCSSAGCLPGAQGCLGHCCAEGEGLPLSWGSLWVVLGQFMGCPKQLQQAQGSRRFPPPLSASRETPGHIWVPQAGVHTHG